MDYGYFHLDLTDLDEAEYELARKAWGLPPRIIEFTCSMCGAQDARYSGETHTTCSKCTKRHQKSLARGMGLC